MQTAHADFRPGDGRLRRMDAEAYLADVRGEFFKLKKLADDSFAQIDDRAFFHQLDPEANSVALVAKHVTGNLISRWTDFLTTDGEKPNRNRDSEFEKRETDSRDALLARWEEGWATLGKTLDSLGPDDLDSKVTIRGESLTVVQAINRQLTHYSYHVGQIVLLAKHHAGPSWKTLSVPRNRSAEFNRAPHPYLKR